MASRAAGAGPLAFLEELAARGDVVPFALAGHPAVLLNRPDHVATVLVGEAAKFPKGGANRRARHLLGNGLLTAEGDAHAARRKVMQPAFARRRLDACAPIIVRRARAMCSRWRRGEAIDIGDALGQLTFGIVGEAILGARVEREFPAVKEAVAKAIASVDPLVSLVAPLRHLRPLQTSLRQVVQRIAGSCPEAEEHGGLLALVGADDQSIDDLLTILLAGHDTITSALTWTLALVSEHPDVAREMRAELDAALEGRDATAADVPRLSYTRAVFAEALRLYPPAWVLARQASAPHRFDDHEVQPGTTVLVSQYLLHRDARFFDRPHEFHPRRWLAAGGPNAPRFAYFPFGGGTRACIGESFGWMEGVLLLATIAQQWHLELAGPFPATEVRITMRPAGMVAMRPV